MQMLSSSQSKGMSGLVQVVQGALQTGLWTSGKAAVKTISCIRGIDFQKSASLKWQLEVKRAE